jgi:hypothetical protein
LFLRDANRAEVAKARDPEFQEAMRKSSEARWYREHLPVAMRNLKKLEDAGYKVAIERVGLVAGEPARGWLHLKETVDSFRFHAGSL